EDNQVNISAGSSVQALSGVAIKTPYGSANVSNAGDLTGNLLGSADSVTPISLSNAGRLSGADLVQGHIVNHGQVSIGKTPGSDSMRVTGDFTQGSEGVLHVATDFVGKTADLLQVDGNVSLDGKVHIVAQSLMPDR